MYTNAEATFYLKTRDFTPTTLSVFWMEDSIASFNKTGQVNSSKVTLLIPYGSEELLFIPGEDYCIKGTCAEVEIKKMLKLGGKGITLADTKRYGSPALWHYELVAE